MSVLDEVLKHLDGNTVNAIAQQLGASPQQAQSAIQVALPTILGGMQRNIENGGAEALHAAAVRDHQGVDLGDMLGGLLGGGGASAGGGLLGQVMGMMGGGQSQQAGGGMGGLLGSVMGMMGGGQSQSAPQSPLSTGMGILGHVLGGSQQRATQGVSQASGLSSQSSQALMAMLAPLVMAAISKMISRQGMDAGNMSSAIGGDLARVGQAGQSANQRGFMGGILDADGDGDVDAADLLSRGSLIAGLFGRK